jgi:hypothetical protein
LGEEPVGYPVLSSLGSDVIVIGSFIIDTFVVASPIVGAVSHVGTGARDVTEGGGRVVGAGVGYGALVLPGRRFWDGRRLRD